MIVCIDPGHGGPKNGASVPHGVEDQLALEWSLALKMALQLRGHEVVLTRTGDEDVGLQARADIARGAKADLFVSLHCNASSRDVAEGAWVIFPKTGIKSRDLAGRIFEFMRKVPGVEDKDPAAEVYPDVPPHVNYNGLGVLRACQRYNIPSCLVELGFLTNAQDLKELRDGVFRKTVCTQIALGIEDWGVVYGHVPPLPVVPEVAIPDELEWEHSMTDIWRRRPEVAMQLLDVDLRTTSPVEADNVRKGVAVFLHRNLTDDVKDIVIEELGQLLPVAVRWVLAKVLPKDLVDAIARILTRVQTRR